MRQRAAVAATPPRSAESDHGQWQQHPTNNPTTRQRSSYQSPAQESRPLSARHMDTATTGDGMDLPTLEGATRRRRVSAHPLANQTNQYHHHQTTIERHSPQHYMAEYSKNYGVDISGGTSSASAVNASGESAAPHSAGGLPVAYASSYTHHGAYSHQHSASEVYYTHYANHHDPQQQQQYHASYDENNASGSLLLRRNNSVPNAHKLSFQHFEKSFHMDPNPTAAVHFRKALHVPDNQYREFLHGHGRDTTPVLNPICCAHTCAGFSCVGFAFLIFIGILLDTQPLFIGGTLPSAIKENDGGKATTIYFMTAERLPAATNAYRASYAYLATMLACLIYVYYERLDSMLKRRAYQDIPDAASAAGASTAGAVGEGGLPEVAAAAAAGEPAYHVTTWNRLASATFTVRVREWAGTAAARVWNGRGGTNPRRRKLRTKTCAKTV